MADYTLRDIDDALWRRVKSQAALDGLSIKDLILRLLSEWLERSTSHAAKAQS